MYSKSILKVDNLTKVFYPNRKFFLLRSKYKPYVASHQLSFSLHEGEILGILGPNGAGKTTMIQMLLGTLKPTSGAIYYFGKDFSKYRSESLQHISHASAYQKLPASLTVKENMEFYGRLYGLSFPERKQRIESLFETFNISGFAYKQAGALSAGQMTRVMLAKAFLSNPKIVLLDEPTASLDPDIALETRQFILKRQREQQVSIILTSHNMQEVTEVCDRVLVLQNGTIVQEDTPEKLAKSVALTQLHLVLESEIEEAISLCSELRVQFFLENKKLTIEIEEREISQMLHALFKRGVHFSHIEIDKPNLEDFFLHISSRQRQSEVRL